MKIQKGTSLTKQLFSFRIRSVKKIFKNMQLNLRKHTMCHGITGMMLGVSYLTYLFTKILNAYYAPGI